MSESSKTEIEAEIRSVVQSMKNGIPLRNLQGDFRSLTGNYIPFKMFGYPTLEAMLRDMPHVVRVERRFDGDIIIHAVATETTQHLTDLISKQKPKKPKKPRRPIGNQSWRPPPTSPHNNNYLLPRPPSRHYQRPLLRTPPSRFPNWQQYPSSASNVPSTSQNHSQDVANSNHPHRSYFSPTNKQPPFQANRKPMPPVKSNFELPPRFSKLQVTIPARETTGESSDAVVSPTQPISSPSFSPDAPEFVPFNRSSVTVYNPPDTLPSSSGSKSPSTIEPGLPWPNPKSNKELIENYAFTNGLKCVYRPCEHRSKKQSRSTWLSTLVLDDQKFVSYPEEMNTMEEANEEAAKRAVEKLNIDPNIISLPVVPYQTPAELQLLVDKVREIVSESSQGAFHYHVQNKFKKMHKMRLPPNWLDLVQTLDSFRIDRADETHFILFNEKSSRSTPEVPLTQVNGSVRLQSPSAESSGSEADWSSSLPEALTLPDTKDWDVFITHASSTANICFRLIDYSDEFESFSQSMEDHYNNQSNLENVEFPVIGAPYCAFVENTWHRVIAQSVEDGMVCCDFPDVGDSEWLANSVIYELDKKFLQFPFQAFQAVVAGLACFSEDEKISEMLINRVIGRSLVAEPTERSEENLTLMLFDTSTDEDININKVILDQIFSEITPPSLYQMGKFFDGFLGDVLPFGEVRLHIVGRSTELITQLLENVTDMFLTQKQENPVTKVSFSETYGALYHGKWHRAIPASEDIIIGNKVSMLLIDVGKQTDIALSDICKLEGETKTLSAFPALAVRCHLSGFSNEKSSQWNEKAKDHLLQLAPEDTPLLIKVASKTTGNQLPVVDLFKRLESSLELVSINQSLAISFPKKLAEVNGKVETQLERKLSRPNSFQAPSLPLLTSSISSNQSGLISPLSPTLSYKFVEGDATVVPEQTSGFPFCVTQDMYKTSDSLYNNPPSSVINSSLNLVVTSPQPLSLPGSADYLLNNDKTFSFTLMTQALKSITPPIMESADEIGITRQEVIPVVGEYFDVNITSAANPKTFICQSMKSNNATQDLFDEMQSFYGCEDNICEMHHCLIKVGEFLALKHKDGWWYRVHVQEILSQEPLVMLLYLVDYGGFEIAMLNDVQVLYKQFRKLPYQAISASLSGIEPVNVDYSPSNCLEFKQMVEEKKFVSVICTKEEKNLNGLHGTHLNVTLVDTSNPSFDVYIDKELIKRNIAKQA